MTAKEEKQMEFHQIVNEANAAKDRLARIAEKLEQAGYTRKARSAMNLVYLIEEWQHRGA